jgi:catechol 2,3-dioxygenase-like lactoylglutathione lyase family enzyme
MVYDIMSTDNPETTMNLVQRMDHFTVVTDRLAETVLFYERLGLRAGPRPGFPFPGAWLYAQDRPVLHLVAHDALPPRRRGVIDHIAFAGGEIVALLEMLVREGVAYRLQRLPRPWSTWQVFFDDPNGAEVEVDFDAAQSVPQHLKDGAVPR